MDRKWQVMKPSTVVPPAIDNELHQQQAVADVVSAADASCESTRIKAYLIGAIVSLGIMLSACDQRKTPAPTFPEYMSDDSKEARAKRAGTNPKIECLLAEKEEAFIRVLLKQPNCDRNLFSLYSPALADARTYAQAVGLYVTFSYVCKNGIPYPSITYQIEK